MNFTLNIQLKPCLLLLVSVLWMPAVFPQDTANPQYLRLNKQYIYSYFDDAADIAISPVRWEKKQWLGFAGISAATLLVYSRDDDIRELFQRNRTDQKDEFTKHFFDPLGTYYLAGIIGGMYIYGLAPGDLRHPRRHQPARRDRVPAPARPGDRRGVFRLHRPHHAGRQAAFCLVSPVRLSVPGMSARARRN